MANVRDSDTSLWLHNKLGTSNDSWTSGSICSQLNKEVLRNIKDCFPDLQTQVKLKLLLSFFHIPRRHVEEWKSELEEVIEVAGIDSELWVSMIAESIKTYPATLSLNTEISDYEETRPIFTDMVNDLRKLVNKQYDLGMLPLECQYLNKTALVSVVGQQSTPVKHFTLKKKPKSAALRSELLQKSADAQSTLKKSSAPTIPLRSRGMPRKMTDTTPLKGIPSRVPTTGFRSPTSQGHNRPNLSRTPAGRKDGGIKLLAIEEQPLGYAAAKKRKRLQELEEQQKKATEVQNSTTTTPVSTPPTTSTPDYAAGLTATSIYTQPPTPSTSSININLKEPSTPAPASISSTTTNNSILSSSTITPSSLIVNSGSNSSSTSTIPVTLASVTTTASTPTIITSTPTTTTTTSSSSMSNIPPLCPVTTISPATASKIASPIIINSTSSIVTTSSTPPVVSTSPIVIQSNKLLKSPTVVSISSVPSISTIATTPGKATVSTLSSPIRTPSQIGIQRIITTTTPVKSNLSTVSTPGLQITPKQKIVSHQLQTQQLPQTPPNTKIVQIKTAPTVMVPGQNSLQNIPPLIPTQQSNIVHLQNSQLATGGRKPVTITAHAAPTMPQIVVSQQQTQPINSQITTLVAGQTQQQQNQQQKFTQVVVPAGVNVKGKTIILTNPNMSAQKSIILRTVGPDGNTIYQQIPISNVTGLNNLSGATIVTGPPGLIKTTSTNQEEQQQNKPVQNHTTTQQMPALVPTNSLHHNLPPLTPVVISTSNQQQTMPTLITNVSNLQQPQTRGTIIRPVLSTNAQGNVVLPQGLTFIQRPGQPTLLQTIQQSTTTQPQQHIQRIITQQQPQQFQQKTTHVQIQQQQQHTTIVQQPAQQQQQDTAQQPVRKGLVLSTKELMEAHEMFRRANRVSRPDKALILGFMAGYRDNPRPNADNVITIKLDESKENMKQADDTSALMLVESLIRLDYNTGKWETFRKIHRLDQTSQQQQQPPQNNDTQKIATQNSVVI